MSKVLKIGTRGSPLALAQVEMVREALAASCPEVEVEVVVIQTSGDWKPADGEVALPDDAGGKALFAKEIEEALLAGKIDAAVHSMKDMDSDLPKGLVIEHMLLREDVRDALLFHDSLSDISQLKDGAFVGTVSVRRGAFLRKMRPGLEIVPFRGNVQTRIDKLRSGQVDATLLAVAGLKRLGLLDEISEVLDVDVMLPAAGQGAVGIEVREDDVNTLAKFSCISDLNTVLCVKAERAVLRALDGSCHSPIGAFAVFGERGMHVRVCVVSPDGQRDFYDEAHGVVETVDEAEVLGRGLGMRLKKRIPAGILRV